VGTDIGLNVYTKVVRAVEERESYELCKLAHALVDAVAIWHQGGGDDGGDDGGGGGLATPFTSSCTAGHPLSLKEDWLADTSLALIYEEIVAMAAINSAPAKQKQQQPLLGGRAAASADERASWSLLQTRLHVFMAAHQWSQASVVAVAVAVAVVAAAAAQ
jgi:hypothetical protein